tara:strand:- start:673 stop:927 length:255 start_codon:yes stop_codon:yes gene_type:complete
MNNIIKIAVIPLLLSPAFLMADDSEADKLTHELYSQSVEKEKESKETMENINKEIKENPTAAGNSEPKNDSYQSIYGVDLDDAS